MPANSRLLTSYHVAGREVSYVDLTFCSLFGPFLPDVTLAPNSDGRTPWANGRFVSLAAAADHSLWPPALLAMQDSVLRRPCGKLVQHAYRELRAIHF